jgi:hypothetical protein
MVKVFGGVAVRRRIAATDMAALQTKPEMNPRVSCLQALLAAGGTRTHVPYLIQMRTLVHKLVLLPEVFSRRLYFLPLVCLKSIFGGAANPASPTHGEAVARAARTRATRSPGRNGFARKCHAGWSARSPGSRPDINSTFIAGRDRVSCSANSMPFRPPGIEISESNNSIRPAWRAATSMAWLPFAASRRSRPLTPASTLLQKRSTVASSSTNKTVGIMPPAHVRKILVRKTPVVPMG